MAARTPPPEFPVRTFPAPVISEQVLVEWVTSELANSEPIVPGTPHPNLRDFTGFKLGIQRVAPSDPHFTQRIWVNDQVAHQEAYNWALKYVSESNAHPIFIRSDRELKTSYSARTKGAALQSVYKLTVTNAGTGYTYRTEPALTFSGGAGSGATGHAIVAPDGTIAEFIIDSGGISYTSAPTFTVAAPPSGTTATGLAFIQPTAAVLVAEEAQQFPQESEFHALYFSVIRVYQTLPGPLLSEQDYNPRFDVIIPKTRQTVAAASAGIGDNRKDIRAIDSVMSEVVTVDPSTIATALGSYSSSFPGTTNLDLPDILESIEAVINVTSGSGSGTESGDASASGSHGGYSLPGDNNSQSSVALLPDVIISIRQVWARNVPTLNYVFFLPIPVTSAAVLSKLATLVGASVSAWPQFQPRAHSIILKGGKAAVQVDAKIYIQYSYSRDSEGALSSQSYSRVQGSAESHDVGASIRAVRIPPTIHGTVVVSGLTSQTQTVNATAATSTSGTVAASASRSGSASAQASVTPTSFGATPGASAIPTSGYYLVRSSVEIFGYGYAMVHGEIVNFSDV